MRKTLIIGVGNILMSDEGVGVAAARALMDEKLPAGVEVIDAGTVLFDVLLDTGKFDRIIIIDAVKGNGVPGQIYRFGRDVLMEGKSMRACCISLHELRVRESLTIAELSGIELPPLTVVGVEPLNLEPGTGLSDPVMSKVPDVVRIVLDDITAPDRA
jgi:hydrogenase maturation protease